MVRTRGGRARGGAFRGFLHRGFTQYEQSSEVHRPRLRDENPSSSDDSTQALNVAFETEFPNQVDSTVSIVNKKNGRGPAKCTKFDTLRKLGPIPLTIKDGDSKVSSENACIFSGRVAWIVKQHANMSYERWNDVPEVEKEELCSRVRADFVLQWERKNHRKAVTDQLRRRFNSFRYELHKIYLHYGSHKTALAKGTNLVDETVWRKLCNRWGSKEFKALSLQNKANREKVRTNHTAGRKSFVRLMEEKRESVTNLIDFYKESRWSSKKGKFVTDVSEDLYNQMVEKLSAMEPEAQTKEAAAIVFKEVMGKSPGGYTRDLREMVMTETSRPMESGETSSALSQDAQYYKNQLEELKATVQELVLNQVEFKKFMTDFMSQQQSQRKSLRETQRAD